MASKEKVPPDKPPDKDGQTALPSTTHSNSYPPGTPGDRVCPKCTRIVTTKKESFLCGFCLKRTHISCAPGSYTPGLIDKLNETHFKFTCVECEKILPKKEPIKVLFDESVPSKLAAETQKKLDQAISNLTEETSKRKAAQTEALHAKRDAEIQRQARMPDETAEQVIKLQEKDRQILEIKQLAQEKISELKRKLANAETLKKQLKNDCLRLTDVVHELAKKKKADSEISPMEKASIEKHTSNSQTGEQAKIAQLETEIREKPKLLDQATGTANNNPSSLTAFAQEKEIEIRDNKIRELMKSKQSDTQKPSNLVTTPINSGSALARENQKLKAELEFLKRNTPSTSTPLSDNIAKDIEINVLKEKNQLFERDLRSHFEKELEKTLKEKDARHQQQLQQLAIQAATQKQILETEIAKTTKLAIEKKTIEETVNKHNKRVRFHSIDSANSDFVDAMSTQNSPRTPQEENQLLMEQFARNITSKIDYMNNTFTQQLRILTEQFQELHKTVEHLSKSRATSPVNNSLNDSLTSPRGGAQNVNINVMSRSQQPIRTQNQQIHNALSYAQALAASKFPTQSIRNIRIMGEPDEANATAQALKKDRQFTANNIRDVSFKSPHNLTVKCKSADDAIKLEAELQAKYGDSVEISSPKEVAPMIKVTNITIDVTDNNELMKYIRESNYWTEELNFVIEDRYTVPATNGPYQNIILSMDLQTQKIFLDRKKVILGMTACRTHEHTNLISCKRCQKFGHFSRNCNAKLACRRCGEEHQMKDCTVTENQVKCVNCERANRNGAKFNIKHRTTDERCNVRKQRIEGLKQLFIQKNPI